MKFLSHIFILLGTLSISACDDNTMPEEGTFVAHLDVQEIADAQAHFSWDLFKTTISQESPSKNILLSPLSVQTALHMALNGAKAETQDQIRSVLNIEDLSVAHLNKLQAEWIHTLVEESGHPELNISNGVFSDPKRIEFNSSYERLLIENYNASIIQEDFLDPNAPSSINEWVKNKTNDKINGIVDNIDPYDLAFLINTIYFKADWSNGFSPDLSFVRPFKLVDGTTIETEFVSADRKFTFVKTDEWEAVDIPFKDSTYSLTLIQPEASVNLDDWAGTLDDDFMVNAYDRMDYSRAMVQFPKMDLDYKRDLKSVLKLMEIENAFLPSEADFGQMGRALLGPNIYINTVAHKTALKIDEKGAEGAAATSIGFGTNSAPPSLIFDQAFLLILRHVPTNTIVFIGKVADPSAQ